VVLFKAFQVLHGGLLPKAAEPEVVKAASGKRIEAITLLRFHARPYGTDSSAEALALQAAPYIPIAKARGFTALFGKIF